MIHRTLAEWDAAGTAERDACALALAPRLPDGLIYAGLARCALAGPAREVAFFQTNRTEAAPAQRFALVPGGTVRLGFDADAFEPSPAMLAEWETCAAEWELPPLQIYLARVLAPARTVTLPPLLVETQAWEAGWMAIGLDDPEARDLAARHPDVRQAIHECGEGAVRVTREPDGTLRAERADGVSQADLLARLARDGWSLPEPDAWEHLCGAGARTLFRWGDDVPLDNYPTDLGLAGAYRRAWAASGGASTRLEAGVPAGFDAHRRPNGFGLRIAENPHHSEVTAAPGVTRGGDGGVSICGGAGFLLGWLPLASAYHDPDFCEHDPDEVVVPGYTVARRVRALD